MHTLDDVSHGEPLHCNEHQGMLHPSGGLRARHNPMYLRGVSRAFSQLPSIQCCHQQHYSFASCEAAVTRPVEKCLCWSSLAILIIGMPSLKLRRGLLTFPLLDADLSHSTSACLSSPQKPVSSALDPCVKCGLLSQLDFCGYLLPSFCGFV